MGDEPQSAWASPPSPLHPLQPSTSSSSTSRVPQRRLQVLGAYGAGGCGSGDAWVAKARRSTSGKTSSGSAQVPPKYQGQNRGPGESSPSLRTRRLLSQNALRGTRGRSRLVAPANQSPRPLLQGSLRSQSCYEEDERWASGSSSSTPPWDAPEDPPRAPGPREGAATSPRHLNQSPTAPWAGPASGHENHLLKGRCGGCQEVKTAQALPIAFGEENRTVRPGTVQGAGAISA